MPKLIFIYLAATFLFLSDIKSQTENRSLSLSTEHFNTAVNARNGDFIVLAKDSFYLYNTAREKSWLAFKYKKNELDTALKQPIELNFIHNSKQVLFYAGGGGQIYAFRDSSILRLDKSFLQKNQFGACGFEYKDKILLYGGYGFYSYKPYFTEFSERTKEWFLRPYANHQYLPEGRQAVVYQIDKKKDFFFMASGYTLKNPFFKNVSNLELNDVWKFDLQLNKWTRLGFIDEKKKIRNLRFPFIANGIFYAIEKGPDNAVVKIDIINNSFKIYKTDHLVDQILVEFGTVYNPKDQHIITVIKDTRKANTYTVVLIPLKELEHSLIFSAKYYRTLFDRLIPLFLIILVLGCFIYFNAQFRKRKRLKPESNKTIHFNQDDHSLSYEGNIISFEEEHLIFLNFLVEKGGEVSNNELLDFIRRGQESTDTLKKRKLKLITDINQIFRICTGLREPFLLELKDDNDRRYKDYLINPIYEVKV